MVTDNVAIDRFLHRGRLMVRGAGCDESLVAPLSSGSGRLWGIRSQARQVVPPIKPSLTDKAACGAQKSVRLVQWGSQAAPQKHQGPP